MSKRPGRRLPRGVTSDKTAPPLRPHPRGVGGLFRLSCVKVLKNWDGAISRCNSSVTVAHFSTLVPPQLSFFVPREDGTFLETL